MSKQFDLHKLIKEEVAKLALEEQAIVKIKLDDITFDDILSTFKNKYYKRKMSDIGDGVARYRDGVTFPQASDSRLNISDPTLLDKWKEEIKKEYGNVELIMDPSEEWFNQVKITDPKFVKDKQDAVDRKGRMMREGKSTKKHVKALLEARVRQMTTVKEGVMAELDIIMDEASDFKDFLKRINRDSRLETSLLNSPDMIKFFTKIWKESGRSI